jgi:hypothetical protein
LLDPFLFEIRIFALPESRRVFRLDSLKSRSRRSEALDTIVAVVDVEIVIPPDDPNEACRASETVNLLREAQEHAEPGDVDWLTQHG